MTGEAVDLELMYVFSFCVLLFFFWVTTVYVSFAKSKMKHDVQKTKLHTMRYLKDYNYSYGNYEEDTEEYDLSDSYSDYMTTRERKAKVYRLMYEEFQKRQTLNKNMQKEEKNYVEVLDVDTGEVIRYIIDDEK
jgi:hypothetical protein